MQKTWMRKKELIINTTKLEVLDLEILLVMGISNYFEIILAAGFSCSRCSVLLH